MRWRERADDVCKAGSLVAEVGAVGLYLFES